MKWFIGLLILIGLLCSNAHAEKYYETFDSVPDWEKGWLDSISNISNFYGQGQGRGNNPDGLWISDGTPLDNINIDLTWCWSCCITDFSISITTWADDAVFIAYNTWGGVIEEIPIESQYGAWTLPGSYQMITLTGLDGMGGFSIIGDNLEGNTSIDNIFVQTGQTSHCPGAVPEPITMWLFGCGLVIVGLCRRFKDGYDNTCC